MKKLLILIVVGIFATASSSLFSQGEKSLVPKEKVGLGVKLNDVNLGASFTYAMKENIHLGAGFGAGYVSGTDTKGDDGGFIFNFNPFFRYIFNNQANLFPYFEVNLAFYENFSPISPINLKANSIVNVEFGGMWFPFSTVSIRGGVNTINFNIDDSRLGIGVLEPFLGIDWWL